MNINKPILLALSLSLLTIACSERPLQQPIKALIDDAPALSKQLGYPYSPGDDIPALAYIEHNEVYNPESVIPPQCYTKTDGDNNPCYACHQSYQGDKQRPNIMNDGELQGEYQFSDLGTKNHWKNLFVDRRPLIKDIDDRFIRRWINQDNYAEFVHRMEHHDNWKGEFTPIKDLSFPDRAFDTQGVAIDGSHWIAFNYKPFPSTFWPTNGSTGDAMIRLPQMFREKEGRFSQALYFANLALLEMAMKNLSQISVPLLSEPSIGEDLNNDGRIAGTVEVLPRRSHFLGDASAVEMTHMLYPQGTEFLHTVRYIGVDEEGKIYNAPRMKEVRYMKKHAFKTKEKLSGAYYREAKEKHFEKLPQTRYLGDQGINNNFGWTINAYIEDQDGRLRQQHAQELAFCNGCHKTIGSTYDQTFSFPRKVDGAKGLGLHQSG